METKQVKRTLKQRLTSKKVLLIIGAVVLVVLAALVSAAFLLKNSQEHAAVRSVEQVQTRSKAILGTLNTALGASELTATQRDDALKTYAAELTTIHDSVCTSYTSSWFSGLLRLVDWSKVGDRCDGAKRNVQALQAAAADLQGAYADDAALKAVLGTAASTEAKTADEHVALWTNIRDAVAAADISDSGRELQTQLKTNVEAYINAWNELKKADEAKDAKAYEAAETALHERFDALKGATDAQAEQFKRLQGAFNTAHKATASN